MAERYDTAERTEMPTPRRLVEARRQGHVARSAELSASAVLVGGFGVLCLLGGRLLDAARAMVADLLSAGGVGGEVSVTAGQLWAAAAPVLAAAGWVFAAVVAIAAGAGLAQVGVLASVDPIRPDVSRIAPAEGLRRIFSRRTAVRTGLSVLKAAAIGAVALLTLRAMLPEIMALAGLDIRTMAASAGELIGGFAWRAGLVLAALAAADLLYQRWQWKQDLKMTRREYIEDMRRSDGDERLRTRRKQKARRSRLLPLGVAVPRATVIVAAQRGPAVAIRYAAPMRSPQITAVAVGDDVDEMRRIAERCGVTHVENTDVARALAKCSPGSAVPRRYGEAVAEIVAYAEALTTERVNKQ